MPHPRRLTAAAAALVLAAGVLGVAAGSGPYDIVRERAFDMALTLTEGRAARGEVVVVDIDRETLSRDPRLLGREGLAALIESIAAARARAVGLDILIEGADERSPAALARRLAEATGDARITELAGTLPDGDARLLAASGRVPVVLGVALSPEHGGDPGAGRAAPILVQGRPRLDDAWQAGGVIGPPDGITGAARGLGVLALPGDGDARVRRAPLLAFAGGRPVAGLAPEVARVARGAGATLLTERPLALRIGPAAIAMGSDAMLRLRPGSPEHWRARTLAASRVLGGDAAAAAAIAGRIVLVGSSAPELGGLRPAARVPLAPSVQLQADALEQILTGDALLRPAFLPVVEVAGAIALAAAALWLATTRAPLVGALLTGGLALTWAGAAFAALLTGNLLVDPVGAPALAMLAFGSGALVAAARTLRREARLRQRFEQHLAPEIVRRIVERPDILKLDGEMREITALFTDVEGFTSMTERADPRALVAVLDRYFEGLTQVVVEHGGMVEKIVGDGLHALFNAPLDLADHPARALACARAIATFSDRFRRGPAAAALGFGRTRVGLETGMVVVGDIGGGRKLDYTAHGDAMNTAARLEALNKELGSTVCAGPAAASRIGGSALRSLGVVEVRGRSGGLEVFEPWPTTMSEADRQAYSAAMGGLRGDLGATLVGIEALAARHPGDGPLQRLAVRLRMVARKAGGAT